MSVLSASYADTASYAVNAISASYISGSAAIVTNLTSSNDANINGLTVGRGNSAVSSNTVLGIDAGRVFSSTTTSNVAVGWRSLYNLNGAGSYANTAVGVFSLLNNTAGIGNTAVGTSAAVLSIGSYNTAIGVNALARASSGDYNIWLGYSAAPGGVFTSGFYNTIIGSQINLGVSTLSNNIIIADGQGNIKYRWDATQNNIYGNLAVTGSVTATLGFTGSLFGTASWAENAISASYVSGSAAIVTNLTSSNDALINGVTVGKGGGSTQYNTAVGISALRSNTTGFQNTAIGYNAMLSNIAGERMVAIGSEALYSNNTGFYNTALGFNALYNNSGGYHNTATGYRSMYSNTSGNYNTAIGLLSLYYNSTGEQNTALGHRAGYGAVPGTLGNTSGTNNIFIGFQSVGESTTESNRTWIGNTSTTSTWLGGNLILGSRTNIGYRAQIIQADASSGALLVSGSSIMSGSLIVTQGITGSLFGTSSWAQNAITASHALSAVSASYVSGSSAIITNLTGSNDALINGVTVGRGYSSTFQNNTVLGETAFVSNTAGSSNTAVGYLSLTTNTTGQSNTAIGAQALRYNQTATNSTAIGRQALLNITSGQVNIGIGVLAGSSFTSGDYNIHIGTSLGGGLGITNGSYNVILGNQISGLPSTLNNNVIISDGQGNIKYRWDTIQNNFNGNLVVTGSITATQNITASNALITGTVTAQTLIVQTVTSSVIYSSGSNIFGNDITNQQTFTGSVNVTGSLTVNGSTIINTTNGYFLPPTMNESQRTSLGVVPVGSIVYQTDGMEGVYVYTSTGWRSLTMV
jgi:hypothetical protein